MTPAGFAQADLRAVSLHSEITLFDGATVKVAEIRRKPFQQKFAFNLARRREFGRMLPHPWRTLLALGICALAISAPAEDKPRHVVLVVWDGMRPDFVTERYSPTLNKLAHEGVQFRNHHSVYPTATDVNGAALATGAYPNHNGLFANLAVRAAINPRRPVDTADPDIIRRGFLIGTMIG